MKILIMPGKHKTACLTVLSALLEKDVTDLLYKNIYFLIFCLQYLQ